MSLSTLRESTQNTNTQEFTQDTHYTENTPFTIDVGGRTLTIIPQNYQHEPQNPVESEGDIYYDAETSWVKKTYVYTKNQLKRILTFTKNWIISQWGERNLSARTRTIGIRVRDVLKSLIPVITNTISTLGDYALQCWKVIEKVIYQIINSPLIQNIYTTIIDIKHLSTIIVFRRIATLVVSLALLISSQFIFHSFRNRLFVAIVSVLIAWLNSSEQMVGTALAAAFLEVIQKLRSTEQPSPQIFGAEVRADVKEFVGAAIGCITALYCCSLGLQIPTDATSLDAILKRHSLLGGAIKAWEKITDYFTDLFTSSLKIITKYIFGKAWIAPNHIEEIERLCYRITELTTLGTAFELGRDIKLSYEIEALYRQHMHLKNIYSGNKDAIQKLLVFEGPLKDMYRIVSSSNPRSLVMRKEPVCIALKGKPGIGKTYLVSPLQQDLLKINGMYDPDQDLSGFIYARAAENEFWDSYKGQPIVIYDDFGQKVDSQVNPNMEFWEIIRAVNTFPWQLHSAAIHEKSNNPMMAEFIVLTTNLVNWAPTSIQSPEALQRRIHLDVETDIIDEIKDRHGRLCVHRLAAYQNENGLDEHDLSHYRFRINGGNPVTYNELIVAISKQYEKHLHGFEHRVHGADFNAPKQLPPGAFSANPRWVSAIPQNGFQNGYPPYLPFQIFMRLSPDDRASALQQNIKIVDYPDAMFNLYPAWEDEYTLDTIPLQVSSMGCNLHPELKQEVLFFLIDNPQELDWSKLIKWTWNSRLSSEHIDQIFSFYHDENWTKLKQIYRAFKLFLSIGLLSFAAYKTLKYLLRPDVYHDSIWHLFKELIVTGSSLAAAAQCVNVPLTAMVAISHVLMTSKCIGSKIFSCHCEACSGQGIQELVKKSAPELHEFLLRHRDNPETLRRLRNLLDSAILDELDVVPDGKEGNIEPPQEEISAEEVDPESSTKIMARGRKVVHEHDTESATKTIARGKRVHFESKTKIVNKGKKVQYEDEASVESSTKINNRGKKVQYENELDEAAKYFLRQELEKPTTTAKTEGVVSQSAEDLATKMRKQTLVVFWNKQGKWTRMGQSFVVCGRKALMNAHFFQYLKAQKQPHTAVLKFAAIGKKEGFYMTIGELMATAKRVKRNKFETEFYLVTLNKQPSCNMLKHFMSVNESSKLSRGVRVRMLTTENEGEYCTPMNRDGTYQRTTTVELKDEDLDVTHMYPESGCYDICSQGGDCGSPLIANSDMFNGKIFGIHHSGIPGYGYCSLIFKEDLKELIHDEPVAAEPNVEKDCFQFEDIDLPLDGSFIPLGRATQPVVQPCTTKLELSPIYGLFGETQCAPAHLAPALTPDGPMLKGLKKYAPPSPPIDKRLLEICIKSYEDLLNSCPPPMDIERELLTFEEACAGITGNQYFPSLNKSKSAGFPLSFDATKGKHKWFGPGDWDFTRKEWLELKQELIQEERMLKQGIVPNYVFVDTLKDEKRPIEKVKAGKTRVFAAAPMKFSILFRRYFSGFLAYMARTKIDNEVSVGTSVSSLDWGHTVDKLQFNKQDATMIAGDFSNFDGTVHYDIFQRIGQMIDDWYCDEHSKVRMLLWGCISQAKHICHDLVYQMTHGQPSGNPSTAVSNSIYNSIATRYAVGYVLGYHEARNFNANFRMVAYGDDNIISVHPNMCEKISPQEIADGFDAIGMTYTSETKGEQINHYRKITEVNYLKRSFVYDEELNWWFAPLSLTSIHEMCNWIHKCANPVEAARMNCDQAVAELVMHDKKTFVENTVKIRKALRKIGTDVTTYTWEYARQLIAVGQWKDLFTEDMCWV